MDRYLIPSSPLTSYLTEKINKSPLLRTSFPVVVAFACFAVYSVAPLSAGSMPPVGGAWDAIHHRGGGACVKPEGEKGLSLSLSHLASEQRGGNGGGAVCCCVLPVWREGEGEKERKGESPSAAAAAVAVVGVADTIFVLLERVVIYLGGGGA